MSSSSVVIVKAGRETPLVQGHPWIFSGAVERWEGDPTPGGLVDVHAHRGEWLGRGLCHPEAGLCVRVLTRRADELIDADFVRRRLDRALALRDVVMAADAKDTDAYRLVYSEADGLSGLIVDRYGAQLSIRVGALGWLPFLPDVLAHLEQRLDLHAWRVTVDDDDARREGIDPIQLATFNRGADAPAAIRQNGFKFEVDVAGGQKTGFYLDQRVNRRRMAAYARGRRVLSCHCYTGALDVQMAAAGAQSILAVDRSAPALEQARRHLTLNGIESGVDFQLADVPALLRAQRDRGAQFDLIVLDPPRFVFSATQLEKGLRAYKDINLLALKLLAPGGILATFSCSGLVSAADLRKVIGWAALDAGRSVRLIEQLSQPPDHPVLVGVPETEYLKGLIAVVD